MKKTKRAAKAFEDFTGRKAVKLRTSRLPDENVAGWEMGPMVGVAYEATRDGKTQQYFHEFKPAARPRLIAQDDGKQLYIEGGKYKVTDRGIEDMPKLFVVNPSPRKGRSKRKAAPMARRRTATRRKTRQVAVFNSNPVRRRRPRRRTTRRHLFARNPAPRRHRRRRVMRRNPIATHRRRRSVARRSYRRNPSARGGAMSFGKMFLPAAGIGLGAIGAEIIMGYLPIPASFKTGVARHVTKGVVGIAAGMLIGKVLRQKRLGNFIALGAVVIAVHDGVKEFIAAKMPAVHLGQYRGPIHGSLSSFGGMGYTSPAQVARMGQYMPKAPAGTMSSFGGVHSNGGGGETEFAV